MQRTADLKLTSERKGLEWEQIQPALGAPLNKLLHDENSI